jgi:hypothetical protein
MLTVCRLRSNRCVHTECIFRSGLGLDTEMGYIGNGIAKVFQRRDRMLAIKCVLSKTCSKWSPLILSCIQTNE